MYFIHFVVMFRLDANVFKNGRGGLKDTITIPH